MVGWLVGFVGSDSGGEGDEVISFFVRLFICLLVVGVRLLLLEGRRGVGWCGLREKEGHTVGTGLGFVHAGAGFHK